MKKQLIASALTASMLLSMSGCSLFDSDNKAVLAVADEYCKAILEADVEDIIDVMVDGDDYEYEFNQFFDSFKRSENNKKIMDAITDSMTYKINTRSVHSSKKDKKASVDVVYTMVDYDEIYDIVKDDDGDIDDYIDALEDDAGAHTMEISQTIDLVMKRDKWLVKDKGNDNFYDVYEFIEETTKYSWCNFKAVTINEFETAIKNTVYDYQYDYYYDRYSYYDYACYYGYTYSIYMYIFDGQQDAIDEFNDYYYKYLVSDYENGYFDGSCDYSFNGSEGYCLFDGDWYGSDYYGGYFLSGNMVLICYSYEADSSDISLIDHFLQNLGYPTPD